MCVSPLCICVSVSPYKRFLCNLVLLMEIASWRISNLNIPFSDSCVCRRWDQISGSLVFSLQLWNGSLGLSHRLANSLCPKSTAPHSYLRHIYLRAGAQQSASCGTHREARAGMLAWLCYKRKSSHWAVALGVTNLWEVSLASSEPPSLDLWLGIAGRGPFQKLHRISHVL